jgi:predicted amidohydrolase YtcJ
MEAVVHGTRDAAWACRAEHRIGTLREGMTADFVVLDVDPFESDPGALLHAEVLRTVIGGVPA